MNINEFKKHLHAIHNTLDDPSLNNQLKDRLNRMNEGPVNKMVEYKPDQKVDKSTDAPTTTAGDSLRPKSKTAEKMEKIKEGAADASAAGGGKPKKKKNKVEEIEIPECVQQYFENYFGDALNEDTPADDIVDAVNDLIYLCEAVCDAVGLKKNLTVDEGRIVKPYSKVVRHPGKKGGATIKRGSDASSTFVPPKYADSKTKIRTLRPQKKSSGLDTSLLPVVGPGQPDYHQM